MELDWQDQAACRGGDNNLFFSVEPEEMEAAKDICRGCSVSEDCLTWSTYGTVAQRYGIFGGYDGDERHNLRRRYQRAQWPSAKVGYPKRSGRRAQTKS